MRVFQWVIFIALITVSTFFTVNLALGLGCTPVEQAAMVAGAVALEGLKAYVLIAANTAAHRRCGYKATGLYLAYGFVALYSLSACLGYALATVDHMGSSTVVVDHDAELAAERGAIVDCDAQIATIRTLVAQRQAALMQSPRERQGQVRRSIVDSLAKIDGYQARKDVSVQRLSAWRSQDQQARSSRRRSLYEVVGQALGFSAARVAFAILTVFSLAIEMGIFLSSPHAEDYPLIADVPVKIRVARRRMPRFWTGIQDLLGSFVSNPPPVIASVQKQRNCRSPSVATESGKA